ncbi:S8 family serine peptidase [Oceanobacillus damuensis]|uniref:S8 family serine peptidase n=1 Tax=Oceanobacillus damuensis TaxID=937928 RepID=UPI00082B059A|nr:S8 family serine peptidase [Oceanobacillus damuensis]
MSRVAFSRLMCLFFSLFVLISFAPVTSYGMDSNEVEVIIGYENEAGKQVILEKSSELDFDFSRISAVAVTIDRNNLNEFYDNPNITYIENNAAIKLSNTAQTITEISGTDSVNETEHWNIQSTGAPFAWAEGFTGKGINIAIIDTGISSHPDLEIAGGYSAVDYTTEWTDDNGHGTHVAGVIGSKRDDIGVVGIAPESSLYAVKALDADGKGGIFNVVDAIEWSIENNMDIINLSLGYEKDSEDSEALRNMLDEAYDSGILVVGASGNDGNSVTYPAKYDSVIGVSAVDGRLNIAGFSSTGAEVEFSAPGFNIISTYLNDSYGMGSGTSQASPHVSGMLAILKQKFPQMTNGELREELINHTEDLGEPGRDPLYGHGFITYTPDDQIAPGEVADIKVNESTADSLSIGWKNPEDEDFSSVAIYWDDSYLTTVDKDEEAVYFVEGLEADTEYTFTFYTEDIFGNQSEGISFTARTVAEEPEGNNEEVTIKEKDDEATLDNEQDEKKQNSTSDSDNEQVAVTPVTDKPKEEQLSSVKGKHSSEKEEQPAVSDTVDDSKGTDGEQGVISEDNEVTEESPSKRPAAEKASQTSGRGNANPVDSDKIRSSLNSGKNKEDVSDSEQNEAEEKEQFELTQQADEGSDEEKDEENTEEKESESKNIFTRFFNFIGNLFVTIIDWLGSLFS